MQRRMLAASVILSLGACFTVSRAQFNLFTVSDSIQMVHFNDPSERSSNSPVVTVSPDGSTALLVTTKGMVASNEVESTLWAVDLRAVTRYLEEKSTDARPSPKRIATVRGQLRSLQSGSYGSLITKARWALDSKSIWMLVEHENARRELENVDTITGLTKSMSEKGYSVDDYNVDDRGVLYSADKLQQDASSDTTETTGVFDTVRGISIYNLLQPSAQPARYLFRADSRGVRPIAPAPLSFGWGAFSISPDGTKVITLVPVEGTPIEWKKYLPGDPALPLYRMGSQLSPATEVLMYEVVDLHTLSRRPLLDSPSGAEVGYFDAQKVVWSSRGDRALVTNTFMPLENQTEQEREARRRPCAVAYIDMAPGSANCVVLARSSKEHESTYSWAVSDVRFDGTERGVVIELSWRGRHETECYSLIGGVWMERPKSECVAIAKSSNEADRVPIRLELRQSLDEPPSLWGQDVNDSHSVEIWNPNPQIEGKVSGTTSVFHWLDKRKREWTGGLMLPDGFKPGVRYPFVIQTHGFSPGHFLVDGVWPTAMAARPLAAAGFVVLQIEDRYEQNMSAEEARLHVGGYKAAIDQLAKSGVIDPRRVGIIGFSRTCWFVEEALLDMPERFAAAVLADGVDQSYLQYMLNAPESPETESERYNGGEPFGKSLKSWLNAAPGFRLSRLETPLRLQAIGRMGVLEEWEIYASLRIQNKPVDMMFLPFAQHVLQNPTEIMASEQGDVDWFRYWLKGEQDHDPAKRIQYERWDQLRHSKTRSSD
jgi:hypothetical protein